MTDQPGAPPLPTEYGAIRPGVDEAPGAPLLRGRPRREQGPPPPRAASAGARTRTDSPTRTDNRVDGVPGRVRPAPGAAPAGERQDMIRGSRVRGRQEIVRGRRSRRIVRRLDTWTVAKVSMIFYLCALLVIVIAGIVVWNIASAFGVLHSIDKSVRTLFSYQSFTLHAGTALEYTVAAGFVIAIIGTIINTLAALVYNLISDVVGGVQVVVVADDIED
jgi:hypothetical protein